ncbi:MAG TPA: hypothetical protein VNF74_02995 [Terriglobales bacterium]|nr:hypothetical protein [Terriglobales bacterium]
MARRPITNPLEYLQAAGRRWIWIVVPTIAISAATVLIARKLPKVFSSSALILVEEQKVPTDFVKPTVSSNVAQRLESIEQQILSRTQLSQIIKKYGLYRGQGLTEDQQVTQMVADITVVPIASGNPEAAHVTAFRIAYQGRDPVLVQQVAGDLSNLFISENLKSRAQQAQGTEGFIDSQLSQATQNLQSLEAQLKQLKSTYMGSLPEQQSANLQVLGQLQTVMQADSDDLARAQQQKTYLISLGQAVAQIGPQAANGTAAPPSSQAELDLRKAKSNLAVAEQIYKPDYPDVIRLQAQVRALTARAAEEQKEKKAPASAATASAMASNQAGTKNPTKKKSDSALGGLPPQEAGQIAAIDQEIQQRTQDQKGTQAKIAALQARIERLPEVEEKLSNLQNAYDVAKANYTSLLELKERAAMGAAMEQQAEGEEFRIVDPANLPQKPMSPDLARIDMMGCLAGLLVGLGLAGVLEMRDAVVRNEADVAYYTQMPMLAVLPLLPKAALALPAAAAAAALAEEPAGGGR